MIEEMLGKSGAKKNKNNDHQESEAKKSKIRHHEHGTPTLSGKFTGDNGSFLQDQIISDIFTKMEGYPILSPLAETPPSTPKTNMKAKNGDYVSDLEMLKHRLIANSGSVKLMRKYDFVLELNNEPIQRDKTTFMIDLCALDARTVQMLHQVLRKYGKN